VAVDLVPETFDSRLGESFTATPAALPGAPLALVLSACTASPHAVPGRSAFSLTFHAPDGTHEPQQTFAVEHSELGEFLLFLVPLGPDSDGMAYEAVVN
jgi:hypothetical protein